MKIRMSQVNEFDRCAVFYADSLVITVSHNHEGYELLLEVDTDESATNVPVSVGTAAGQRAEYTL